MGKEPNPNSEALAKIIKNQHHHNSLAYRMQVVLRLGQLLQGAGASSFRIKTSMSRLAKSLGIEHHQAFVTTTEIVATAHTNGTFRTEMVEQRSMGVNADLIDKLNRFVAELPAQMSPAEAQTGLDEAFASKRGYGALANALASGFACAGFSFLNGGGPLQMAAVFVAALIGQWVRRFLLLRGYNHFGVWMICGALASGLYMGVFQLITLICGIDPVHHGGIVAAILFLVPGFPLVTGIMELVRVDLSAAVPRLLYVAGLLMSAGTALWLVTKVANWTMSDTPALVLEPAAKIPLEFLASFVAAYGFAMLFNSQPKACLAGALIGAFVNTPRIIIMELGVPRQVAVGLAALVIGLLAAAVANKTRYTRVSLSVPGAVIMIPGVFLYESLSNMHNNNIVPAADAMVTVLFTVSAIGVGLAAARMLTDRNWRIDHSPELPVVPDAEF